MKKDFHSSTFSRMTEVPVLLCVICVVAEQMLDMAFHFCHRKDFFCSGYKFWGVNRHTLLPEMKQVITTSSSSLKSAGLYKSVCQAGGDPGSTELHSREAGLCSELMLHSLPFGLNRNQGSHLLYCKSFVLLHRNKELHTTSLRDEQLLLLITL